MANNSTASGNVTHLNTAKFDSTIAAFKKGIDDYNTIKSDVERTTNTLFLSWQGKGKKQFEKDYNTIYQQLEDIADIMYELYDTLVDAEATYILADEETAKLLTMN